MFKQKNLSGWHQVTFDPPALLCLQVWWCWAWPACATATCGRSTRPSRWTGTWRCTGTSSTSRSPSSSSSSCSSPSWRPTSTRTWWSWCRCSPSVFLLAGEGRRIHSLHSASRLSYSILTRRRSSYYFHGEKTQLLVFSPTHADLVRAAQCRCLNSLAPHARFFSCR